jgi:hypothetical protein
VRPSLEVSTVECECCCCAGTAVGAAAGGGGVESQSAVATSGNISGSSVETTFFKLTSYSLDIMIASLCGNQADIGEQITVNSLNR